MRPWCNSTRSSNLRSQGSNPWGRAVAVAERRVRGSARPVTPVQFRAATPVLMGCSFSSRTALCDSANLGAEPRHRPKPVSFSGRTDCKQGGDNCP